MRNAALILGVVAVAACSVDHVVVAALDPPSAGRAAGGGSGAAGSSVSAGTGGSVTASDAAGQGGRLDTANGGGAAGDPSQILTGDAGASSRTFCACLSTESHVCGSDGITYPTPCEEGGLCWPPAIDCLHACPCLANEPDGGVTTSLSPGDCVPMTPCSGDKICWILTNAEAEQQPPCN